MRKKIIEAWGKHIRVEDVFDLVMECREELGVPEALETPETPEE